MVLRNSLISETQNIVSQSTKPHRFPLLDLARFFAALSVVFYHYTYRPAIGLDNALSTITKFGYLGVPVFFMISGFVITASAQNRTALGFAVSRFVRLYPTYWAAIAITLSTIYFLDGQTASIQQILANLSMLNDYFGIGDIDGVYWTLQVELKFYACTFLLIALGVFDKYKIWLTAWLLSTITHTFFGLPSMMGWFINPNYSCFFITGVAWYLLWREGPTGYLLSVLSASFVLSMMHTYWQASGFIENPSLHVNLVAALIVAGAFILFGLMSFGKLNVRNTPLLVSLGSLTYPLYLIHARAGRSVIGSLDNFGFKAASIALTIVLVIIVSYLVTRFIEKPIATPMKSALFSLIRPLDQKLARK